VGREGSCQNPRVTRKIQHNFHPSLKWGDIDGYLRRPRKCEGRHRIDEEDGDEQEAQSILN